MGPDKELFSRLSEVSRVTLRISGGMFPVKELNETSRTLRPGEKEVGMLPEKLFCWRKM